LLEQVFNHQPSEYACPFCLLLAGSNNSVNAQQDIVERTARAAAFISPRWWPNNHGHVLVVPTAHYENLYDLPNADGHAVHDLVRKVAIAMRTTYGCEGISTRQHNEPAGNQDAWHYHVHVFPRFQDDHLYESRPYPDFVPAAQRRPYAEKLRAYFALGVMSLARPSSPTTARGCRPASSR
jgi:histidine triad (HIT) family protein